MNEAPRAPGATGYGWYVALLLAGAHLLSFVDRFLLSLVAEPVKAALRLSDLQLGLLQGTGFALLYAVVAVPLGRMADRVHRRNLIVAGMVLWSVATMACGLADTFGTLFAARVAVGFGEAALVPAAMSLLAAIFPPRQLGRAVSLFTAGASLGKSAALIGGGAVLAAVTLAGGLALPGGEVLAPWQATFVLMGLPGLAMAALLLSVREPARGREVGGPSFGAAFAHIRSRRTAFATHVGASAIVVLLIQSIAAWAPAFYARFLSLGASQAGYAVGTATLIAAPLGHLAGGMLTDAFQARGARSPGAPVIALGLIAAIPALVVFATARSLPLSLGAYGALTFCLTLAAPASLAGLQMLAPDRVRGTVTAMFLAVTTLVGVGLGPPLIGLLSDRLEGLDTALLLAVPVLAVAGAWLALASRAPFAAAR
ncbi:MFS transporter [Sphingomonas sp. CJ20]